MGGRGVGSVRVGFGRLGVDVVFVVVEFESETRELMMMDMSV